MSREQDVHDRMVELAERVLQRTLDNEIRWVETDREEQYLYPASNSGVTIERFEDQFDGELFQMTLLNASGKSVQELSSGTVSVEQNVREPAPWNSTLERLYDAARREALGIDNLLDQTLRDVDQGVSKTDRAPQLGGKRKMPVFDDPWATAKTTPLDDDPPF